MKLLDISIPDYVLKNKRILNPDPTSKSKYKLINNTIKNKKLYKNIINNLPTYSSSLVLIGYSKKSSKIIDFISTHYNIKQVLKSTKKTINDQVFNHFDWLNIIMKNNKYKKIKFFIAKH